ncbi:MAG: type II toxin-antitoxin system RelE/ParE family toxin [bacterium]|nr:type II toxin-antitoxin system RelE/ParE family toxin [bacterium]
MNLIKIIVYSTKTGKEPFSDWENGLDKNTRAVVIKRLDRIRLGNFGDAKIIKGGNGIWELRIDHGPGYRIYFGKKGSIVVILLMGGEKRSQNRDIAKSKRYWLEYKESQ